MSTISAMTSMLETTKSAFPSSVSSIDYNTVTMETIQRMIGQQMVIRYLEAHIQRLKDIT